MGTIKKITDEAEGLNNSISWWQLQTYEGLKRESIVFTNIYRIFKDRSYFKGKRI